MSGSFAALRRLIADVDERTRQLSKYASAGPDRRNSIVIGLLQALKLALERGDVPYNRLAYYPTRPSQMAAVALSSAESGVDVMEGELDPTLNALANEMTRWIHDEHVVLPGRQADGPMDERIRAVLSRTFPVSGSDQDFAYLYKLTGLTAGSAVEREIDESLRGVLVVTSPVRLNQAATSRAKQLADATFTDYVQQVAKYSWFDKSSVIGLVLSRERELHDMENTLKKEAELKGIGLAASALLHRSSHVLTSSQYFVDRLPTADHVARQPTHYNNNIAAMAANLRQQKRLQNAIVGAVSRVHATEHGQARIDTGLESKPVMEVLNRLLRCCDDLLAEGILVASEDNIRVELRPGRQDLEARLASTRLLVSQFYSEVFHIHIENTLREIRRPETTDKTLYLEVRDLGDHVGFGLVNMGPPIPPDVKANLDRTIRVQRPHGNGLGAFLSCLLMADMQGRIFFESPYSKSKAQGTRAELLFRKEPG